MNIREFIKYKLNGRSLAALSFIYNHLPFNNRFKIKGKGNRLNLKGGFFRGCLIEIVGNNNELVMPEGANNYFSNCKIRIFGNDNVIKLGKRNSLVEVEIWIEDNANTLQLGNRNVLLNNMHIAITEGKSITLGDDNVVSSKCTFRTGDSHSILLRANGQRINHAKSICLQNHIWIGSNVTILKGARLKNSSVVATGSIVTKPFDADNVIIGGNPAKILKTDIEWCKERI